MEVFNSILLATAAFWLGACPFSVWLGRYFLGKDITRYGDGNPGSANVFHAGSPRLGLLAVFLDIAKGMPFVFISHALLGLPHAIVMLVGLGAILGHAFSPILKFKGGKSVAVTFGVLIALSQQDILFVFTLITVLGFLFIEQHSWVVMSGPIGTLIYLLLNRGFGWESFFMLLVLFLFITKQYKNLQTLPAFNINLITWLQSRRRET
jgi:acyl-phosphate glycerol 3-phosphate acyltransferase